MKYNHYHSWRIAIYWEKLAGLWPYREKVYNNIIRTWLLLLIISVSIPVAAKIVEEFGINVKIVVENSFGVMLCLGVLAKVIVAIRFKNNRKQIYDTIFNHISTIRDLEEAKVLQEHYDYGLRFSFYYEGIIMVLVILFHCFHILIVIFNYFFNESDMIKMIPFHLEYFVDEVKYFYYICVHLMVSSIAFFVGIFAFDCAFFMQIQHICALFKIVTLRLERTFKWETEDNLNICNSTKKNKKVYNCILSAIKLHLEVIKMVDSIEEIYNICMFVILVENMVGIGGSLYIIHMYAYDLLQVVKYSTIFIAAVVHFYVMFTQGQNIIDSSLCVFNACYNCPWYSWNKNLRQMLFIIMARSIKSCKITGGLVFVISMETYEKMMKIGFSCYAVFKMREDFS
ncbi:uncharacterized protein LOC131670649 isoform X2 [Phymastichus coffea]|uniref:uncharacterized protein LOC131670649 isoform X2 n=1 Tax=Phymastichus coffea TaxID=108790 RepID=UPI00273C0BA1|nr:uncharacterized protein LOC131670649 isoform X2 [Phymastichus coffea]